MVSVDVIGNGDFGQPVVVDDKVHCKKCTVFYLANADETFALYGTFDELLDFSAGIARSMYSWPIVNGHADWLGDLLTLDQEDGDDGVTGQDGQDRPGQQWGDSAEAGDVGPRNADVG
jgi:hypothetical protein